MQYFKDENGHPWAYEDGVSDSQMRPGLTRMSPDEVAQHLNPPSPPITADGLKSIVTHCRWEVETGGLTLPGGVRIATAIDDQNRITSVVANAERSGVTSVDFKAASGWVSVTVPELQEIAAAIARHVQACFTAERQHHEAIDAIAQIADPAERQAALEAYDESQGWPQ
ncbi:DUF4376 domain-containing protein [Comamonas terrigena]|uniref:DUF4376 domain-containing protein n=1 Tax=Comamonas terrigena TaxID=32013 RepID=UPI00244771CE|nr:DUF4376 domain-containing protein [Comamonas terrigena]MDH1499354.1 DUF4376 domain-containing protein [Comamonas terrigena]